MKEHGPATSGGVRRQFVQFHHARNQAGLTLVELLIGMSITVILTGLTIGSVSIIGDFVTTSEINNLMTDLYYSRSEAIKRKSTITICRSEDGESCATGSKWEEGWIVFSDSNRNRVIDEDDKILLIRDKLPGNSVLTLGSGYYYYIMFSPTGEAYPRNTFKYCRAGAAPKAIILFATGRARVSTLDSGGNPLKC